MENSVIAFPFRKLTQKKYLTIEVLMFFDYITVLKFMFSVNRQTRTFFKTNNSTIRNSFINDGLIEYDFSSDFEGYMQLERLYFQILKRNFSNRILTLRRHDP